MPGWCSARGSITNLSVSQPYSTHHSGTLFLPVEFATRYAIDELRLSSLSSRLGRKAQAQPRWALTSLGDVQPSVEEERDDSIYIPEALALSKRPSRPSLILIP